MSTEKNAKRHYSVYEVQSNGRRNELGKCYADRPSRCLRKIAFKNCKVGQVKVIDVEEKRSGQAERPIKRYKAKCTVGATSESKRKFKAEHDIGNPEEEVKVEILEESKWVRRGDSISPHSSEATGSKPSTTKGAATARDSSPRRGSSKEEKIEGSLPVIGGYSFKLVATSPSSIVYTATKNNQPLPWKEALASLRLEESSLNTAMHKLIASAGKSFKNNEFSMTVDLSSKSPNFQVKFRKLSDPSSEEPDFSAFQKLPQSRVSNLPNNIMKIESKTADGAITFVPKASGQTTARYGKLSKFFSSETKQSQAILSLLANEAIIRGKTSTRLIGSSRPIHWVQFQVA